MVKNYTLLILLLLLWHAANQNRSLKIEIWLRSPTCFYEFVWFSEKIIANRTEMQPATLISIDKSSSVFFNVKILITVGEYSRKCIKKLFQFFRKKCFYKQTNHILQISIFIYNSKIVQKKFNGYPEHF